MNNLLKDKRALILGVASNRSIAYGIANSMHQAGATIALGYQNERLKERVKKIGAQWKALTCPCDVASDEDIHALFDTLKQEWGHIDIIVHAIAYAPREALEGNYLDNLSREAFTIAHDISSYSFAAVAKAGQPLLSGPQASLLTLSYLGAERVIPNYNVMGVAKASLEANVRYLASDLGKQGTRVNAISAGPIRTLAASGIKNFRKMLGYNESATPLQQNVTIEQVGQVATFLCSDWASGITGEIIHVDAGYHIVGMGHLPAE